MAKSLVALHSYIVIFKEQDSEFASTIDAFFSRKVSGTQECRKNIFNSFEKNTCY